MESGIDFCFDCSDFPCKTLCHLDSRYRTKYGMSMVENLASIKKLGIQDFVKNENRRWNCRQCGEILCVHKPACPACGDVWNQGVRPVPLSQGPDDLF